MNIIALQQTSRLLFGSGCAPKCAEFLASRGRRRVLLVTSTPVRPTLQELIGAMHSAQLTVVESLPIDVEPTITLFQTVLRHAQAQSVDAVVGAGGGSAMDVAKLVAALLEGTQSLKDVLGINLLHDRKVLLVCLPTTSGTGSEVSPNAILLDEAEQLKKAAISPHLVPDAAFVDPRLTLSVPPAITAGTGLDALTHCIEAFANTFAHPITDLLALEGVRLISTNLVRTVRQGNDEHGRAALALGSLYGGMCLGPVNTAAVHALAYPLGSRFHVAHGISNAVLLPHVIRFNASAAPERYATVARALGCQTAGDHFELAMKGAERLQHISAECGVEQRLRDFQVPRAAIPDMARSAMTVARLLKNNLRPVTESDAAAIYEAAY